MRKFENWDSVEAYTGDYETLKPGGYVCKILKVQSEEKDYGVLLRIAFDIAEGEHKDFYKRQFERKKQNNPDAKWPGMYTQTIRDDNLSYFKGFITVIENSNPGFKWDWDEKKLVGKLFGGVFGEEEFEGSDGKIRTTVKCRFVRSVDKVRAGEVEPPPIKRLEKRYIAEIPANKDDDLPF